MKKAIMILAILVLVSGAVIARSQTESPSTASADYLSNMTAAGTLPIVKEQVALSVLTLARPNIEDMETNYAVQWLEEKTNIDLRFDIVLTESQESKEKLNLILASGDKLPDILLSPLLSLDQLNMYGSQGKFQPINDLIDTYGVEIKRVFQARPELKGQMTAPDGNIYGFHEVQECHHCSYRSRVWMNMQWLENLGLPVPSTTDQFYQTLKAFKEQDANGNGDPEDEIAFSGAASGWMTNVDTFIMNAFIYNDAYDRLNLVNDKVMPAFTQPEWREGLRFLNRLYSEGLLDHESFIQDGSQLQQLGMSGDHSRIGAFPGGGVNVIVSPGNEREQEYDILPPLTGPEGNNTAAYYMQGLHPRGAMYVITSDCDIPEIAYRFGDWLISDEAYFVSYFGEEGVDWRKANPGEVGVDGKPAMFQEITTPRLMTQQNKAINHMVPVYVYQKKFLGRVTDLSNPYYIEYWLERSTANPLDGHDPDQVLPLLSMKPEDSAEYSELKVGVNEYMKESIARFITGEMDVDDDWNSYLKELDQISLQRYVEMTQSAYDRQYRGM